MGLRTDAPTTATPDADLTILDADDAPTPQPDRTGSTVDPGPGRVDRPGLSGWEAPLRIRASEWLYRSHQASVVWLLVRIWLGYQWIDAGYQKIWGSERSAFWFGNGAGVKGFATAGVAGSASGKGGASYGWWAAFLHNFVIPNSAWIAKVVSLAEILIGLAILLGLFTGAAAAAGLSLNVVYMFSGSAGVNPMYAILSVLLVLAWRNAGWLGLDRVALPAWRRLRAHGVEPSAAPSAVPSAPGSPR
jgi:thiosulfate dehydrogenase [quinone] large subunit